MTQSPPSESSPLEVNITRVFTIGTAAWIVGLITVLVADNKSDADLSSWALTCVFGVALGILALVWTRLTRRPGARRNDSGKSNESTSA